MFWSPWNPYPIQAAPGLHDDPLASPQQIYNQGAFDQRELPPQVRIAGKTLERVIAIGGGRSGEILVRSLERMERQYGARGRFNAREWFAQEYCWNREGANFGGGVDRVPCLYEEVGARGEIDPQTGTQRAMWFFAYNVAHPQALAMEGGGGFFGTQSGPIREDQATAWLHRTVPSDPVFDPFEFDPEGYPVWGTGPLKPNGEGTLAAPFAFMTTRLAGLSKSTKGGELDVHPHFI